MSLRELQVTGATTATPTLLAALFWAMGSDEQADFFAELERIAGSRLCFQMAGVVQEIRERADNGDYQALNGFQTMLSHAQAYGESATDYRVSSAKQAIEVMVCTARERIGGDV